MSKAQSLINNQALIESLKALMWSAGDALMDVYCFDDFGAEIKGDDSPVTKADLAAHHVLVDSLAQLTPDIPIVSEEDSGSLDIPKSHSTYWLTDPLDGTKECLKRNDEFTCNLALIENNVTALGAIMLKALYPLRMDPKRLVATDSIHAVPVSLLAGPSYLAMGETHLKLLGLLMLGSVPAVILGCELLNVVSAESIKKGLAIALILASLKVIY